MVVKSSMKFGSLRKFSGFTELMQFHSVTVLVNTMSTQVTLKRSPSK